jgi:hypothetical protein
MKEFSACLDHSLLALKLTMLQFGLLIAGKNS